MQGRNFCIALQSVGLEPSVALTWDLQGYEEIWPSGAYGNLFFTSSQK